MTNTISSKTTSKQHTTESKKTTTVAISTKTKKMSILDKSMNNKQEKHKDNLSFNTQQHTKNVIPIEREQKKMPATPSVAAPSPKKDISTHSLAKKEISHTTQPPKNAHISHNYREVEALRRGLQLQKEMVNHWHPPVGTCSNCTCDISFFVNKQGKIENLKTIKSSGTIMFDISARQALFSMQMPQWTKGKSLIISFKQ